MGRPWSLSYLKLHFCCTVSRVLFPPALPYWPSPGLFNIIQVTALLCSASDTLCFPFLSSAFLRIEYGSYGLDARPCNNSIPCNNRTCQVRCAGLGTDVQQEQDGTVLLCCQVHPSPAHLPEDLTQPAQLLLGSTACILAAVTQHGNAIAPRRKGITRKQELCMKGWVDNDIIKRPPTVVLHSAAFKCCMLL